MLLSDNLAACALGDKDVRALFSGSIPLRKPATCRQYSHWQFIAASVAYCWSVTWALTCYIRLRSPVFLSLSTQTVRCCQK